jgi:hypothetical protein
MLSSHKKLGSVFYLCSKCITFLLRNFKFQQPEFLRIVYKYINKYINLIPDFHREMNIVFWFWCFCTMCEVYLLTTFRKPTVVSEMSSVN